MLFVVLACVHIIVKEYMYMYMEEDGAWHKYIYDGICLYMTCVFLCTGVFYQFCISVWCFQVLLF